MAMKKSNSVRTKPAGAPPLPKTPAPKPTMATRKPAKSMSADAARKANAKALKAANAPSKSTPNKTAATSAAAKRALLTPPAKRTAAQKMALSRAGRGGGFAGGLNINNLKK